jgi:hypothetical protein
MSDSTMDTSNDTVCDGTTIPQTQKPKDPLEAQVTLLRNKIAIERDAIAAFVEKGQQRIAQLERELDEVYRVKTEELQKQRQEFELSSARIELAVVPARVKLDVGGRVFSVTMDMMTKYPDSFFSRLFSGRWEEMKTDDGAYFINRSAKMFDYIVDFLRDGELELELSGAEMRALFREADFYQLRELADKLSPAMDDWTWIETPNAVLSNGGLTLTAKDMGTQYVGVCLVCSRFVCFSNVGFSHFKVRMFAWHCWMDARCARVVRSSGFRYRGRVYRHWSREH